MKYLHILLIVFLCGSGSLLAQRDAPLTDYWAGKVSHIEHLLKYDKVEDLASLIVYPLERPDPFPTLGSPGEFISYYPTLFGAGLKAELLETQHNTGNAIQSSDALGLLDGGVWLNHEGYISGINYISPKEEKNKASIIKDQKSKLHPSVADFESNVYSCLCFETLIRVDRVEGEAEYRFAIWRSYDDFDQEPIEIRLSNNMKTHGSQGGVSYQFDGGEYSYILEDIELGKDDEDIGIFLKLVAMTEGLQDQKLRCRSVK